VVVALLQQLLVDLAVEVLVGVQEQEGLEPQDREIMEELDMTMARLV
jgi:hypothetical protein